MKWLGIIAFTVGLIVAVVSGAKVPEAGSQYPDTLVPFVIGIVVGIVGLIIWHIKSKEEAIERVHSHSENGGSNPVDLLKALMPDILKLKDDIGELDEERVCDRVDELLDKYVLPFAEVRQNLITMMGMSRGAEVLVTVAFGERILNRVWSASSDGHLGEARAVLPEAIEAFEEANVLVKDV